MGVIDFEAQRKRSKLYKNIRSFFEERGYLEVFTPNLSKYLIPEPTIKSFKTEYISQFKGKSPLFLLPSPEYYLKRMISEGSGNIYEISRAYRNTEELSDIHSIEFDILEYYTMDKDERFTLDLTIDLIKETAVGNPAWLSKEPLIMSMKDAFKKYADIDLDSIQDEESISKEIERLGLIEYEDERWEDSFNRIFLTFVESSLPKDRMVFITDYPNKIECLAENNGNTFYKKRWEMYINGIEIANTYFEETDKDKIKSYFEKEQKILETTGEEISTPDPAFPLLNMRKCSGGAIGLDRLLMVELGYNSLSPLLSFPLSDILS